MPCGSLKGVLGESLELCNAALFSYPEGPDAKLLRT